MRNKVKVILESVLLLGSVLLVGLAVFHLSNGFFDDVGKGETKDPKQVELFGRSIFRIVNKDHTGGGTGFAALTPSGVPVVITNAHVCAMGKGVGFVEIDLDDQFPELGPNTFLPATIIATSSFSDICVLRAPNIFSPLKLSDKNAPRHSKITIIGYPLLNELTPSDGLVLRYKTVPLLWDIPLAECSGPTLRRAFQMTFFGPVKVCVRDLYAADTNVVSYPGNSGSPALNALGEVVGVLFAGNGVTNYGSIVPVSLVNQFIGDM